MKKKNTTHYIYRLLDARRHNEFSVLFMAFAIPSNLLNVIKFDICPPEVLFYLALKVFSCRRLSLSSNILAISIRSQTYSAKSAA